MQDIGNNMDHLFRKAAADYPLKTGEGHWVGIAPAIESRPIISAIPTIKSKQKTMPLLIGLLFLFLLTGALFIPIIRNNILVTKVPVIEKEFTSQYNAEPKLNVEEKQIGPGSVPFKKNEPVTDEESEYPGNNNNLLKWKITPPGKNTYSPFYRGEGGKQINGKPIIVYSVSARIQEKVVPKNVYFHPIDLINPINTIDFFGKTLATTNNTVNENVTFSPTTKLARITHKKPGVYFGLSIGAALNTVKNQELNHPGYVVGVVAGYQWNDKMAIESGLLLAKKYYFSEGKYFNMEKISSTMPAGMQIISLKGSSIVFELPVKIKYDFLKKHRTSFFSSVGLTSYVLTKEKNNYLVIVNGTQSNQQSAYNSKSSYIAAAVDISAGYEHKIGRYSHVRLEPYLQIPLTGIGVGRMPVMSSGVHFRITRATH